MASSSNFNYTIIRCVLFKKLIVVFKKVVFANMFYFIASYTDELGCLIKVVSFFKWFCDLDILTNPILLFSDGAEPPILIMTSLCLYELALKKHMQDRLHDITTA